jgi:large subunit ribosomal protein L16
MLVPKKVKHRKWHKGRTKGVAQRGNQINFGSYALKATTARWVTSRQIEASRRSIIRYLKKGGKLWIRVFPDKPITFKGIEVGMGGGKGDVDHYVVPIKPGRIIFELDGLSEEIAKEALTKAAHKLPVKTRFIKREL